MNCWKRKRWGPKFYRRIDANFVSSDSLFTKAGIDWPDNKIHANYMNWNIKRMTISYLANILTSKPGKRISMNCICSVKLKPCPFHMIKIFSCGNIKISYNVNEIRPDKEICNRYTNLDYTSSLLKAISQISISSIS